MITDILPIKIGNELYINGEWRPALSGKTVEVINPANQEIIGTVANGDGADTRSAIEAAHQAFGLWRKKTAAERADKLHALAGLLKKYSGELAHILTLEQGKPLAEARGELGLSAAYIAWFAEEARRLYGDTIPSPWGERRIFVSREPVGVVGAITPWNFPSSMLARKIGAALAAGCTIVAKPALQTPYSGLAWAALAAEAGIPAGVVNVVTGNAAAIGDEMLSNPLVRKITFTGSTGVGLKLAAAAAAESKRISMELGGNAPFIVFDDADIDLAVEHAVISKFRNAGQACVSANRFMVHRSVHDVFVEKFRQAVSALQLGDGLDPKTAIGPMIDGRAAAHMHELLADAKAKGAEIVSCGAVHGLGEQFVSPTLVVGATDEMRIVTEEIFGPLAPIIVFDTEDEAIKLANDTEYGLACYFFTRDLARAFRLNEALEYGQVGINAGFITTEVAPFGGVKKSGSGREGSMYGCDDYLNLKYTCLGGLN